MSHTPFMQLYVADYLGDTQHLTTEQHGAYLLILMTMWRNGGVLPNDKSKLARIARVTPKRWHLICDDVMEFFDIEDDIISQKRLVEEYQKAVSKSEKRKISGSLGGKAKSLKNNNVGLAIDKQTLKHSSEPDTRYNKKDTNVSQKKGCRLPKDFQPDYSIAIAEGFTQQEAEKLFEVFKDYWNARAGKEAIKLDWQATWRNHVRRPFNQKFKGNSHANTGYKNNEPTVVKVVKAMSNIFAERGLDPNEPIPQRHISEEVSEWEKAATEPNRLGERANNGRPQLAIVTRNAC